MTKHDHQEDIKTGEATLDLNLTPSQEQIEADLVWLEYVGKLPPDDATGAFLLSSELPNERFSPRQILAAILRATRRAFQPATPLEFSDYELGRIWGTMRVLLPQGREYEERFNGEPGWKATGILGKGYEARPITAYYRQRCMNPLRVISRTEAVLDTSDITFVPDGQEVPEYISESSALNELVSSSIARLREQYQALHTPPPRSTFRTLIDRYFRFRN